MQSLKIKTDTVSGDARLYVDDAVLLSVPETEASRKLFSELGERLDSTLELELAPYDIKILGEKGSQSLVIRRKTILTEEELLPGMPPLAELRDRINDALNRSRRGNMLTDYFD